MNLFLLDDKKSIVFDTYSFISIPLILSQLSLAQMHNNLCFYTIYKVIARFMTDFTFHFSIKILLLA